MNLIKTINNCNGTEFRWACSKINLVLFNFGGCTEFRFFHWLASGAMIRAYGLSTGNAVH